MKNRTVKGIIALAVVTALSFAVIIGSNQLSKNMTASTQGETAEEAIKICEKALAKIHIEVV